jgi:macrolide-specific efflux system membrane fusion protein
VTLVDDTRLRVEVRVAESDVARLRLGQAARVTFDALPEQVMTGTVTFIAPKATTDQNVVAYAVTVEFANPPDSGVRVGMTANISVVTARKQGVLLVPSRAVRGTGAERVVEQPAAAGKAETIVTPVRVGLVTDADSEIAEGLREGDAVVLSGGRPRDGGSAVPSPPPPR